MDTLDKTFQMMMEPNEPPTPEQIAADEAALQERQNFAAWAEFNDWREEGTGNFYPHVNLPEAVE